MSGSYHTDPSRNGDTAPSEPVKEPVKKPKKPKKQSRSDRWSQAVGEAQDAASEIESRLGEIEGLQAKLADAMESLNSLKEEYEEWQGNLPENLAQSALGEKLEAVTQLDFDVEEDIVGAAREALERYTEVLGEAEGADLPQGFGRD